MLTKHDRHHHTRKLIKLQTQENQFGGMIKGQAS